jgi:hypothetical protein
MKFPKNWLNKEKYKTIKFQISKTNHLLIKAKVNGIAGVFILDTGASSSCIGFSAVEKFNLKPLDSELKASGAGATGMLTQIAKNNVIQLRKWKRVDFDIVLFDLIHVNEALKHHKSKVVDGIIGADILMEGKAIINYKKKCFYLQK